MGRRAGQEAAPPRPLAGLLRFLALELAPVVGIASLTDAGGTSLIFAASPGAVADESNQVARELYARFGALSPMASVPMEFLAVFTLCAFASLGLYAVWPSESRYWRWPALMTAVFPFFAVSSWLTAGWAFSLWPAAIIFSVFAAGFAGIRDMPPRGGWA